MSHKRSGPNSKSKLIRDKMAALKDIVSEIDLNNPADAVICRFCSKSFPKKNKHFKDHQKSCSLAKPLKPKFSCKVCNKKYMYEKSFNEHLEQEHSTLANSLSCNKCPAKCPDKEALKKHKKKAHTPAGFECPHCHTKFSRHYHVLRHIDQKGCNGESQKLSCKICASVFTRKDNLMYHLRKNHMSKSYVICKVCSFGAKSYNSLLRHHSKVHFNSVHQCDICEKIVKSRVAMKKHLEIHGEKKYECAICGYKTYTAEVIKRHMFSHSADKPIKCPKCPESFIQHSQLRTHMLKHSHILCDICFEPQKNAKELAKHLRLHLQVGKLNCPYIKCSFNKHQFEDENNLEEHLQLHSITEYACGICSKQFAAAAALRRHVATHALERPRRCMYCVRACAFARGERLLKHVRAKHPLRFLDLVTQVRCSSGKKIQPGVNFKLSPPEVDSILEIMDDFQDCVLNENSEGPVFYGGIIEEKVEKVQPQGSVDSPLMNEEELTESLSQLLVQLIDKPTLEAFGWPNEKVDVLLEKVIERCGQKAADRERWTRVQCLRENAKHLFLHVIEDKDIKKMLEQQTIDQVVRHILSVNNL